MIRIIVFLLVSCLSASAQTGQPIKQSGNVTPGHAWAVTTNGIAQDAGTAAIPYLTSIGTVGQGQTICAWSALSTAPGSQKLCFGVFDSSAATITLQNFGIDAPQNLNFVINGATYTFPYTIGGILGPNTSVIGDGACWNNTIGTLLKDCGGIVVTRSVTSAYTIGQSGNQDCGLNLVATGGTFYAISQSGSYAAGCRLSITNNDPMPTGSNSTGAKFVNFVNCNPAQSGTYLWPHQTMEVTYINSVWVPTRCPGLWVAPSGVFTLNVDPSSGSVWGGADGLGLTTRAFNSIQLALEVATETIQENFISQTELVAKLCSGCTDANAIHWPSHGGSPFGAQGGVGTVVDCNGGILSGDVEMFFQSTLGFQGCTFTSGLSVVENAVIVLATGGAANTLSGATFTLAEGGRCRCLSTTLNITGNFATVLNVSAGASLAGLSINQTGNVTYSDVGFRIQSGSFVSIVAWVTNGFSATGTKYAIIECASMEGATLVAGTGAGSTSCTQAN